MTQTWMTFSQVFDGDSLHDVASVRIEDGHIAELSEGARAQTVTQGCLTPGYLDLQVNGGGGVQLNSDPRPEAMAFVAASLRPFGTVGILPTVITDRPEVLETAAQAARAAKGQPGVLGLHIEGPHLAKARRGTHDPSHIRPFSERTLEIVQDLRQAEIPVMITLAPEAISLDQLSRLSQTGAIVSIGHTDATAEETAAAIGAGASCATHLFNAMSAMTSRAPGAVGGILDAGIPFGIICDGHHVDDRMVALALRATKTPGAGFLVSDAMATVGGPDAFELYGQTVRLHDGRLLNSEGNLAGAHITQAEGVQRLVNAIGISLRDALRMAITTPAKIIDRHDLAQLIGRSLSDTVVLGSALEVTMPYDLDSHSDAAE